MTGFRNIHVIDMDTIDLTNLNRQFLFRASDIGKPKATVAADFVNSRISQNAITPHYCKIQDKDVTFYRMFDVVICGLDSFEARRWISSMFVGLVDDSDPSSLKPIIDGGTEGFKGQTRVILPTLNACHECSIHLYGKKTTYPICTIANTPRIAEHCIEWAFIVEWPRIFDSPLDSDNYEHLKWVYSTALARAEQNNISGVTFSLVTGVVKNIIPAIASTNAIISASCVNEALKLISGVQPYLNNYMLYVGDSGIYSHSFELEKNPDCLVCGNASHSIKFDKNSTLEDLIDYFKNNPDLRLVKPSISHNEILYIQAPPSLEAKTRPNLYKHLFELFESSSTLVITDPSLITSVYITVEFL
ncbi:NEDD8-activating enzyme E1 catalytic subunit [Smittium culicis]|uniref:NEDD8-activating enzyme E1 catalytic subunit n=1 Tax=Smittium culicis TaxID=133412 RepID=A0A1R1Y2B2_9FUNG|nr:NEDD8-activating enzyme E1 catalytic subunit [Smittium culicis]